MEDDLLRKIEPFLELAGEAAEEALDDEVFGPAIAAMAEAATHLPTGVSLGMQFSITVYDAKRDRSLTLEQVGYTVGNGVEPWRVDNEIGASQRYLFNGVIHELPHDHCPACWGPWALKTEHPECPGCGVHMGRDVKLLLDDDKCPHCKHGSITLAEPTCPDCDFSIDPAFVAWG